MGLHARWLLEDLHYDEGGVGFVEYALIIAIVAIGCIVGLAFLGASVQDVFEMVGDHIEGVATGQDPVEIAQAKGRRWHNKNFGP